MTSKKNPQLKLMFYSNIKIIASFVTVRKTMEEQKLKDPINKVSLIKGNNHITALEFL